MSERLKLKYYKGNVLGVMFILVDVVLMGVEGVSPIYCGLCLYSLNHQPVFVLSRI
ncbi:transmembrane protein, putative [Medicago truncatula]|uniref:Transmembrane protein, putative n=1 Tax=Medicago truncatula TaxID=3880 RepID=G7J5K7_MEDTR|nr:transmembrane protein, putative [Medicago truncatula]